MPLPKKIETPEEMTARRTENTRRYRARHPDRVREIRKKQYDTRKRRAMDLCGGAFCVRCGCSELEFLEFNHIDGGGCMEYREANNKPMVDRILTNKRETHDLEILCRVCNSLDYLERKNKQSAIRFKIIWE